MPDHTTLLIAKYITPFQTVSFFLPAKYLQSSSNFQNCDRLLSVANIPLVVLDLGGGVVMTLLNKA